VTLDQLLFAILLPDATDLGRLLAGVMRSPRAAPR